MSLAMSAAPDFVCTPATAQLLLPGLASLVGVAGTGFAGGVKRSSAGQDRDSTDAEAAHAACTQRASAE